MLGGCGFSVENAAVPTFSPAIWTSQWSTATDDGSRSLMVCHSSMVPISRSTPRSFLPSVETVSYVDQMARRWSEEACVFVSKLAKINTRSAPRVLVGPTKLGSIVRPHLACASARAFALSLLDRCLVVGSDGVVPCTSAVINDMRKRCA